VTSPNSASATTAVSRSPAARARPQRQDEMLRGRQALEQSGLNDCSSPFATRDAGVLSPPVNGNSGQHCEQDRVPRHLEAEINEFLQRDRNKTGCRTDADPVRREIAAIRRGPFH
jgi:hypothetical protein